MEIFRSQNTSYISNSVMEGNTQVNEKVAFSRTPGSSQCDLSHQCPLISIQWITAGNVRRDI